MILDPVINIALAVLNASMLLCLIIVITMGRRHLTQSRKHKTVTTLLTSPRQCLHGLRRLHRTRSMNLPPVSEEDRL